jgi:large subunit ribosomal protein L24
MKKKKQQIPAKVKLRKGDLVKVIAGDSKGSEGKILEMILEKNRAIVEGANLVSKHTKPNAANPNGGIIKMEAAIHLSNLALVDPKTGAATRVGRKLNEAGKLVRVAKKSGEEIK